jgi:hypothetical protein
MNRKGALLIVAVIAALCVVWEAMRAAATDTIDYRGEKIKLSKFYVRYEDYKDDPGNIDPSENARVRKLVEEAPIARRFKSLKGAVSAVFEVKFPGYGSGGFGQRRPDGDATLAAFEVEIPRADESRFFVFRCAADACDLLDDFVAPGTDELADFHREGANLVYTSTSGARKLVHPAPARP